jgi:NAD(P)-dependent dehydrogenase (short-subunit alcohol dehydrogenase family)
MADHPPALTIVASGALTLPGGRGPEKALRALEGEAMARAFAINTIGPALIARHLLPLWPRKGRHVLGILSARVGSIADNRLGGWHSYRASKAALNMLVKTFAIELARTHPEAIVVSLHPGTVDSGLSRPFQGQVAPDKLFSPERAAVHLLDVIDNLTPADSGGFFAWDGAPIPF